MSVSSWRVPIYNLLKERDGLICGICKESLEGNWAKYQEWLTRPKAKSLKRRACNLTVDHIIPRSVIRRMDGFKGGPYWAWKDMDNLQLAHYTCNNAKGNKTES